MSLVDTYTDQLTADLNAGRSLAEALRDLTLAHAEHLLALGPVGVLALDPCPWCGGTVIASDEIARCASGCKWSSTQHEGVTT